MRDEVTFEKAVWKVHYIDAEEGARCVTTNAIVIDMPDPVGVRYRVTLERVEPELRACPFCATKEPWIGVADRGPEFAQRYYVSCQGCGAEGGSRAVETDAIAAWNRRADD